MTVKFVATVDLPEPPLVPPTTVIMLDILPMSDSYGKDILKISI